MIPALYVLVLVVCVAWFIGRPRRDYSKQKPPTGLGWGG